MSNHIFTIILIFLRIIHMQHISNKTFSRTTPLWNSCIYSFSQFQYLIITFNPIIHNQYMLLSLFFISILINILFLLLFYSYLFMLLFLYIYTSFLYLLIFIINIS